MHPDYKAHVLTKIAERKAQRNWASLPQQFEVDAVRGFFRMACKDHFSERAIRQRIRASKATTWHDLASAIKAA